MNNSTEEKYLGDLINTTGNIKATVARGYGIISENRAIISEVPLISEAWHSVTQDDVTRLEKLDASLLRVLLGSHAKSPLEMRS